MATTPQFINVPIIGRALLSAANTATDGTGTITELATGTAAGTRVLSIHVQNAATSAAALVNIFLSTDSGSTWKLYDQIQVAAATSGNTVKCARNVTAYTDLFLGTGHKLGVTTTIAEATNVYAHGGTL